MVNKKNILCILHESDINKTVLLSVIHSARSMKAHLHFIRIIDSCKSVSTFFNIPTSTMKSTLQANLNSALKKNAPDLSEHEYSCRIREGIWFVEVIRAGLESKSSLIIITEPVTKIANFESNSMHVIRKSPIPIWVARNNMPAERKKILVAVDIDLNDKNTKSANEKCIKLANEMLAISPQTTELYLAHCWSIPNEDFLQEISSKVAINQINEMSKRQRMYHEEWFYAFCQKHRDLKLSDAYFIKGDPQKEIPDLISDEKFDTLIMNTVNSINIPGVLISSSAETILHATTYCSSLTVKPDGFLCPITMTNEMDVNQDTVS